MKKIIIGLILLGIIHVPSIFAGKEKTGEAGFMFLKIPVSAREVSMGMTGLTSSYGANALFWNPATISNYDGISVSFTHLNHFAGITSEYFAMSIPVSEIGTFAAGINYLSYGDIEVTTQDRPQGTGVLYSPSDMSVNFGFSKQITDRVSGGVVVKYIYSRIDQVDASGFAFDFGFTYLTNFRNLKLGFVMSNIGGQSKYDGDGLIREVPADQWGSANSAYLRYGSEPFEMPASVTFGLSMDVFRDEQHSMVYTLEQNVNNFQANRTNFGLEYGFKDMLFLRGGYTSAFDSKSDFTTNNNKLGGLTLGTGIAYTFGERSKVLLDYCYFNQGILSATHRFTIGLNF